METAVCGDLRVSNDARSDAEELRRRVSVDGYLFFRKLQNPDKLLSLRNRILAVLRDEGWLVPGSDPLDGIVDVSKRCTEGDAAYSGVYAKVQRIEAFHRIPHEPELVEMVEKIIGTRTIPVPGHKARIWFPRFKEHTTPMHQDFVHYQGSLQALTCWAPIGDCPLDLGPLAVLPASHTVKKVLKHRFSLGAGGLIVDLEAETLRFPQLDTQWLSADFEVGDTLLFPALTVHRALPNCTEDRLRVSMDNRYQRVGDNIASHMLQPHLHDLTKEGWEDVYRDWQRDDLKYYWKRMEHREVPQYLGYAEKGFAEALERAASGDQWAIVALRRLVNRDTESDDAKRALAALEKAGVARQAGR